MRMYRFGWSVPSVGRSYLHLSVDAVKEINCIETFRKTNCYRKEQNDQNNKVFFALFSSVDRILRVDIFIVGEEKRRKKKERFVRMKPKRKKIN